MITFFLSGNENQNQELGTEFLVRRRIIKVKVKLALEQAIKAKRGSRGVALFFLLGVAGQRHAPAALPSGMGR